MATVMLRNINPLGQVDLPIAARQGEPLGEHGTGCLEPDEVFEVDAKVAGRAPSGKPGTDDYDPGEGLLAQTGNYELADKPAKKRAAAKRAAAKKATVPPPAPGGSEPTTDDATKTEV